MPRTLSKWVVLVSLVGLLGSGCKNPFKSEEPTKQRIRILMNNEYLVDTGRYVAYWDGKNADGNYIAAGKYIVLLEAKDFNDQAYVTAEEGGKPGANNQQQVELGFYSRYTLESPYPNPFKILSGVNIPFLVPQAGRVKISIYKD